MERNSKNANEGLSVYKLLSSYGGAGSVYHTRFGSVIIAAVDKWPYFKEAEILFQRYNLRPETLKGILDEKFRISIVEDERFLEHLRELTGYKNLRYLVTIPMVELDRWHSRNSSSDYSDSKNTDFIINYGAIYCYTFPSWFRGKGFSWKDYKVWRRDFSAPENGKYISTFDPPKEVVDNELRPLHQDNLVLICPSGHISSPDYKDLIGCTCETSDLVYQGSSGSDAGFDSIRITCRNCGKSESPSKWARTGPACSGHKPWTGNTYEKCSQKSVLTTTTQNNLYFSINSSALYIPGDVAEADKGSDTDNDYYSNLLDQFLIDKEAYKSADSKFREVDSSELRSYYIENYFTGLRTALGDPTLKPDNEVVTRFINMGDEAGNECDSSCAAIDSIRKENSDLAIRRQEFSYFNTQTPGKEHHRKISFSEVLIDNEIKKEFRLSKVLSVDNLTETSVQIGFTRVYPHGGIGRGGRARLNSVFSEPNRSNIHLMPSVVNRGEGIFIAFDNQQVNDICQESQENERYRNLIAGRHQFGIKANFLIKYMMLHSFSHIFIRELEFHSGYPALSMKERLYVDDDMAGVLIYTIAGSEGSMGGLVEMAGSIGDLISKAYERSCNCSNDPMCEKSDAHGLQGGLFAACHSCTLLPETTCEYFNNLLDRNMLFGKNSLLAK